MSVAATLPEIVHLRLYARCLTHSRTEALVADHAVTVDEPVGLGGSNLGPTPVQLLLSSWLGCVNVILSRIADVNGVVLHDLELDCKASLRTAGVRLAGDVPVPLETAHLRLHTSQPVPLAQRQPLLVQLHRFCPITTLLRASGTHISEEWVDGPFAPANQ